MENMIYTDCMVDIETTHTMPDRGSIIQISAIKFNLKDKVIGPIFDRCLMEVPWRHWSEGTRDFWISQREETLTEILQRGEDPQQVIDDFAEFAYPSKSLKFWAKPSHFDYNFISSYFNDYGLVNPFHYRDATDMNSFLRGKYYPNPVPELDIPFVGKLHNALYDCAHQIKVLFAHA